MLLTTNRSEREEGEDFSSLEKRNLGPNFPTQELAKSRKTNQLLEKFSDFPSQNGAPDKLVTRPKKNFSDSPKG